MFRRILIAASLAAAALTLPMVAIAQPATTDSELNQAAENAKPPIVVPVATTPAPTPIVNPDGSFNFTPIIDGFVKFVAGVLGLVGSWLLAQASWPLKQWLGIQIDTKEVAKDLNMGKYADVAAAEAIAWVKQQTGLKDEDLKNVEIRNPFLSLGAGFLFKQYPEIWQWVGKGETTVMQWLESKLNPEAALATKVVDGVGLVPASVAPKA